MAKKLTTEGFIQKARERHGDKYDYSKVEYENAKKLVTIQCPLHGEFRQLADNHVRGSGCPKCGDEVTAGKLFSDTDSFIHKSSEIHGKRYDYSAVNYTSAREKVEIICREHGSFWQVPNSHLRGSGCPKCFKQVRGVSKILSTKEFIRRAAAVHGQTYIYNLVEYTGNLDPVTIVCRKHGKFTQTPDKHLQGCGCQRCGVHLSKREQEIRDFLAKFFTVYGKDRKMLDGREIDILLPDQKIGIEHNGDIWHSERYSKDPIWHMRKKQQACEELGIRLIHISDKDNMVIVKKTLSHILGIEKERYYARDCGIHEGQSTDQRLALFFDSHHLQGNAVGCWVGYLTHNGAIVCAAAFSRPASVRGSKSYSLWELRRFASCCRVVGGASRLLKLFIRTHPECERIVSYSDNRWFTGGMYERLGFRLEKELPPDYRYIKNRTVEPKNHFKRAALAKRPDFDFRPEETEHQNCLRNGWYRIYDCGKKRWALDVKSPGR